MPVPTAVPAPAQPGVDAPAVITSRVLAGIAAIGLAGLAWTVTNLASADRALLAGLDKALLAQSSVATVEFSSPPLVRVAREQAVTGDMGRFDAVATVDAGTGSLEIGTVLAVLSHDGQRDEVEVVDVRPLTDVLPVSLASVAGATWYVAVARPTRPGARDGDEIRVLIEAVAPEEPRLMPARAL